MVCGSEAVGFAHECNGYPSCGIYVVPVDTRDDMIVLVTQLDSFSLNLSRIQVERRLSERQSSAPSVNSNYRR